MSESQKSDIEVLSEEIEKLSSSFVYNLPTPEQAEFRAQVRENLEEKRQSQLRQETIKCCVIEFRMAIEEAMGNRENHIVFDGDFGNKVGTAGHEALMSVLKDFQKSGWYTFVTVHTARWIPTDSSTTIYWQTKPFTFWQRLKLRFK